MKRKKPFGRIEPLEPRQVMHVEVLAPLADVAVTPDASPAVISLAGRSLVMTICLCASYKALNMWKNSSCMRSLFARKWISSMRSRSVLRYFLRYWTRLRFCKASIYSFIRVSHER